mgnify:CR=1 FL=1
MQKKNDLPSNLEYTYIYADLDGEYLQTLYHENPSVENSELKHMAMYGNKFYMSDTKNNIIYLLEYKTN